MPLPAVLLEAGAIAGVLVDATCGNLDSIVVVVVVPGSSVIVDSIRLIRYLYGSTLFT